MRCAGSECRELQLPGKIFCARHQAQLERYVPGDDAFGERELEALREEGGPVSRARVMARKLEADLETSRRYVHRRLVAELRSQIAMVATSHERKAR